MKTAVRWAVLSYGFLVCRPAAAEDPEAWRIATDSNAAARAISEYGNNIVRARWAGEGKGLAAAYPANVSCFLPVAGAEQSVSNVQRILDATVAAIPPQTRRALMERKRLAPIVEWLVRMTRPSVTNEATYLSPVNFTSVFTAADFDEAALTNAAARLRPDLEPPIVSLQWCGEYRGVTKMTSAEPVLDYPDFRPETFLATPRVRAMALRAPEVQREFRVRATTQLASSVPVTYKWIGWCTAWTGNDPALYRPEKGYGQVRVWRPSLRGRIDMVVVARRKGCFWGPPSILSFYGDPAEYRVWTKDRLLDSVSFNVRFRRPVPYSLASIALPFDWTDAYQYDVNRHLIGYERRVSGSPKTESFSSCGELILESHSSGAPKVARRVRYFERDGKLAYEETGEEIRYTYSDYKPRR